MKKMNPVVHFEMPANDIKRMSDFYTNAFGWKTQALGEDMMNYVLVSTTETDKEGSPETLGKINGGFFPNEGGEPAHPSVVISVENIKDSMKKITEAGGKVIGEPMEIPGFGMYVSFTDTEGNRSSIMEPTKEMKEKTQE